MKRVRISEFMDGANKCGDRIAPSRKFYPEDFLEYAKHYRRAVKAARAGKPYFWQTDAGTTLTFFGNITTAQCGVYVDPNTQEVVEVVRRKVIQPDETIPDIYEPNKEAYWAAWENPVDEEQAANGCEMPHTEKG